MRKEKWLAGMLAAAFTAVSLAPTAAEKYQRICDEGSVRRSSGIGCRGHRDHCHQRVNDNLCDTQQRQ